MCICQNPEVRSMVVKMLEFARPMSLMHSLTSFMEYLSVWVLCEASEILHDAQASPSFFGHTDDGGYVGGVGFSNHSEPEPFFQ